MISMTLSTPPSLDKSWKSFQSEVVMDPNRSRTWVQSVTLLVISGQGLWMKNSTMSAFQRHAQEHLLLGKFKNSFRG